MTSANQPGIEPQRPPDFQAAVTFLFTDIEGSTRLWERAMGAAGALAWQQGEYATARRFHEEGV